VRRRRAISGPRIGEFDGTPRAGTARVNTAQRLPFDAIAILTNQGLEPLTLTELTSLSLSERVRLLGAGRLVFTSNGEAVDPAVAIRAVYARRRASSMSLQAVVVDDER
jgi:hypothetical protein